MHHGEFCEAEGAAPLVGRHVVLRPLALDDAEGWCGAAAGDRSSYSLTSVPGSVAEARDAIAELLDARARGEAIPYTTVALATGEVVGATRFLTMRWYFARRPPDAVEVGGTWLSAAAQRTGVNTEAKLLMLGRAFDDWGVARVDLKTDARNERSRRAIERLGASFEGVLRAWQPSLVAGEEGGVRDSAMYSLLPAEWPGVRRRLAAALEERSGDRPPA